MTASLILPADEFSAVQQVYQWLAESGHLDCGAWSQDLADPSGTVTCSCGSQFAPAGEAINYTLISAGGGS